MEVETIPTGRYTHYTGAECRVSSVDSDMVYGKWLDTDACFAIPRESFLAPYSIGTLMAQRFLFFTDDEHRDKFLRQQLWQMCMIIDAIQAQRLIGQSDSDALESIGRMLDGLEPIPAMHPDGAATS